MAKAGQKTTTYSLDWEVVVNLESRLIRDFKKSPSLHLGTNLMLVTIGTRLGMRVVDSLELKWSDLIEINVGESFVRVEKKTNKQRLLVMSSRLKEVIDLVFTTLSPNTTDYILSSQKGRGTSPMTIQNFNRRLKILMVDYKVRYIGNCSSHLLRKSWVVGAIRKGFENGDHLSLIKVSRLVGHSNVTTTLKYTNFELSQSYSLYELE
jgi:site-specific recombinase XerD